MTPPGWAGGEEEEAQGEGLDWKQGLLEAGHTASALIQQWGGEAPIQEDRDGRRRKREVAELPMAARRKIRIKSSSDAFVSIRLSEQTPLVLVHLPWAYMRDRDRMGALPHLQQEGLMLGWNCILSVNFHCT